jgi:hypothetical protein
MVVQIYVYLFYIYIIIRIYIYSYLYIQNTHINTRIISYTLCLSTYISLIDIYITFCCTRSL